MYSSKRWAFLVTFCALAVAFCASSSYSQHSLQLDSGPGIANISIIKGSSPGGTYLLPPGGGTFLVNSGSGISDGWLLGGNIITAVKSFGSKAGSAFDVSMVANGVEAMRLLSGGGVSVTGGLKLNALTPIILGADPGIAGQVLTSAGAGATPTWTNPSALGTAFNQITSGTNTSAVMIVDGTAQLRPQGTGVVASNLLVGSGNNKYAGSTPIPLNALTMSVPYSGITATSIVQISILDVSGQTVQLTVGQVTAGVGFDVSFSGYYPSSTGFLHYIVVN